MLNTFFYPLRSPNWVKKLAISWLVVFASIFIPIIPHVILAGYCARIMRHIIENGELFLPDWSNINILLKDGIRISGAIIIYTFPIYCIFFVVMIGIMLSTPPELPFEAKAAQLERVFFAIWACSTSILLGIYIVLSVAIPHMVTIDRFGAIFQVGELWSTFRGNPIKFLFPTASLVGFILGWWVILFLLFLLPIYLLPEVARWILGIIFILVVISVIPFFVTYMAIIFSTLSAQAYRTSRMSTVTESAS